MEELLMKQSELTETDNDAILGTVEEELSIMRQCFAKAITGFVDETFCRMTCDDPEFENECFLTHEKLEDEDLLFDCVSQETCICEDEKIDIQNRIQGTIK